VLLLDSRAVPFTAGHAANITAADQVAVPAGFADPKLPSGRLRSIFRVHLGALAAYRPAGPYPGQLTVLRANGGPDDGSGPDLGWRRFAAGEVATRLVPGHHDSMLHENNAAALAEQVRPLLSLASRSRPEGSGIPG
jgi:thioesterase domain-containing protein